MTNKQRAFVLAMAAGLAVGFGLCGSAAASGAGGFPIAVAKPGVLSLRTGEVVTANLPNFLNSTPAAGGARAVAVPQGKRSVIQLDGPMTPQRRAALEAAGVVFGAYLPDTAYLADLGGADLAQVAGLGFVRWAGAWENAWKIDPEVGRRGFATDERRALADGGESLLTVALFAGESTADASRKIEALAGASVLDAGEVAGEPVLRVRMPTAGVGQLATIGEVRYVEDAPEITTRSNQNTRWIVQTNVSGQTPLYTAGIRGEGQVVGVIDNGLGPAHCAFADAAVPISATGVFPTHRKIAAYNATVSYAQHGTHVAATVAGNRADGVDDNTRGIAYNARIVFDRYGTNFSTYDFNADLQLHHNQGARVHTNSWGDDGTTAYNLLARSIDVFSYANESSLVLFACTNLTTLKNPENAKSSLSVGRAGPAGSQDATCSGSLAGPTSDGRRKPEVFAPGCSTVSATGSTGCSTVGLTGTSMATPATAGAAALVRQYFVDGFYPTGTATPGNGFDPSGALVRAMVINSAVDMTAYPAPNQLPPNNNEGFGRIRIDGSVFLAGDARRLIVRDVRNASGLATGEVNTVSFDVASGSEPLEVTLAFTEPPATLNAAVATVNDLNLRVIDPSGNVFAGNDFDPVLGVSRIGGTTDPRNTAEHVLIATPSAGRWRVEIAGAGVNVGRQGYGLVITGSVAEASSVPSCAADFDRSGCLSANDIFTFLSAYFAGQPGTDIDGNGTPQPADIFAFLNLFFGGCQGTPRC